MLKTESVLKNETYKILWDLAIETDHLISTRRTNLVLIYKKKEKEIVILWVLLFWRTSKWK